MESQVDFKFDKKKLDDKIQKVKLYTFDPNLHVNKEMEIEFRIRLTENDAIALQHYVFKNKIITMEDYRESYISSAKWRNGLMRENLKFEFNTIEERLNTGFSFYPQKTKVIDTLKFTRCSHLILHYSTDFHDCHMYMPRIYNIKYAEEIDLTYRPPISGCEFLQRYNLIDRNEFNRETEASDANLGLLFIKKIYFYIDDVRVCLYSIINDFSEISYQLSLECENIDSNTTLEDYNFKFKKIDLIYNDLSKYIKKIKQPFINTIDLKNAELFNKINMLSIREEYSSTLQFINQIKNIPLNNLKLKMNGERIFAIYNNHDSLVFSNNKRINLIEMYIDLTIEDLQKIFSPHIIYQFEYIESNTNNETIHEYCMTEVFCMRNQFSAVKMKLYHTFQINNETNGKRLTQEQLAPFGFIGSNLSYDEIVYLTEESQKRCKSSKFKKILPINHEIGNSMIKVVFDKLKRFKKNNSKEYKFVSLTFNTILSFMSKDEVENILSKEFITKIAKNEIPKYDGFLEIINFNTNTKKEKYCQFNNVRQMFDQKLFYKKIKFYQTIELEIKICNNVIMLCMINPIVFAVYNIEQNVWIRFDGEVITIDNLKVENNNVYIDNFKSAIEMNRIYEFYVYSDNAYSFFRVRTDKYIPDSKAKICKIIFKQNISNLNFDDNDAFVEDDENDNNNEINNFEDLTKVMKKIKVETNNDDNDDELILNIKREFEEETKCNVKRESNDYEYNINETLCKREPINEMTQLFDNIKLEPIE